jgi:hypothetical protein
MIDATLRSPDAASNVTVESEVTDTVAACPTAGKKPISTAAIAPEAALDIPVTSSTTGIGAQSNHRAG